MADRAFVTPKVLQWARESARMTTGEAAAKVPVSEARLLSWENGESQPTIRQAQTLAKAYKRPFALLFLPEIPRDFQPLPDFRKPGSQPLSTASIFIIREIQQKQAWISALYAEGTDEKLPFVGKFSLSDRPEAVAADMLETLGIQPGQYPSGNPMKEWIQAAEAGGIFVSRGSFIHSRMKLDAAELQGFAISDPYAPFVFVNSDDWNAPQLFTLVHELAHIWIASTGISSEIEPEKAPHDPVEQFCNEVAANALMPQAIMQRLSNTAFNNIQGVSTTIKSLGVSSFAFLIRSRRLQLISASTFDALKQKADQEYQHFLEKRAEDKHKQKEKEGGPNPYLLRLNKNSQLFTQVVLDALKSGIVQPTQASLLLGTPANNLYKLEAQLYR